MSGPASLTDVPAPAKLNVFLHVVGRRADGYHLLQSLLVLIDWADVLHFERRTDGRLARHDLGAALPADDLCLRAARALRDASGTAFGADISIDKRVPWGAGLGGGSSDAASTLLALNRLWGLGWPRRRLLELALPLGADVPFFVGGRNALVEGIGERLAAVRVAPRWWAVVKPPGSAETRAVFTSPLVGRHAEADILSGSPEGVVERALERAGNDLQAAAESVCPDVTLALRWLAGRFGTSRMTGSGSAAFAGAGTGDRPAATWPELPSGWVGRLCRGLQAHPLLDWAED